MTSDHFWLFGDKRSKSEIEKNVEVTHVLVIFLEYNFGMGLSFPCCCFHETGIPIQEIISGSSFMDKVSDFTIFNFDLCAYCEIYQKWSGRKELVFALGEEPVDVVGVTTPIGLVAGDKS